MEEKKQKELLEFYCGSEMKELKKICNPIIYKWKIPQMYHDDLYSDAMKVLDESLRTYDESKSLFVTYLSGNIRRSFEDWRRYMSQGKRCNIQRDKNGIALKNVQGKNLAIGDISLDEDAQDGFDLRERLPGKYMVEDMAFADESGISSDGRAEIFLNTLNLTQRKMLKLLMIGYSAKEVREELKITNATYAKQFRDIKSFEHMKELESLFSRRKDVKTIKEKMEEEIMGTQTAEKSKPKQYTIRSIINRIDDRTIRFDHPLQRQSEQWSPSMKGNLISDILQDNPLPELVFAEQIVNGIPIIWDLDGKQRCTNCYSFANDGFRITKNVRRWNIKYLSQIKNENGEPVLDKNGFPTSEFKEFDIRGKKFSQLPPELQRQFNEYTFKCDQYLNCDSDEIAYHIIRYNEGKSMTPPQKGITRIGEEFATLVKSISAMPFFRDKGGYKVSEAKNGTLDRVVVESVMASKYLDDWNKKQDVICEYLKEHATTEDFDNFEDVVNRLDNVVTDEVADMFDSKNSFLWFSLFVKFDKTGENDGRFVEFMAEFARLLHNKEVNGTTWEKLNEVSTKDKNSVINRLNYLEALMMEFLKGESEETNDSITSDYVNQFCETELMHSTNLSVSDMESVAKDTLNLVQNEEDAVLFADCANSWISEVRNKETALRKTVLPAIIRFVKYMYDSYTEKMCEKDIDSKGIVILDKYLGSVFVNDDVEQNYKNMVMYAA